MARLFSREQLGEAAEFGPWHLQISSCPGSISSIHWVSLSRLAYLRKQDMEKEETSCTNKVAEKWKKELLKAT